MQLSGFLTGEADDLHKDRRRSVAACHLTHMHRENEISCAEEHAQETDERSASHANPAEKQNACSGNEAGIFVYKRRSADGRAFSLQDIIFSDSATAIQIRLNPCSVSFCLISSIWAKSRVSMLMRSRQLVTA